MRLTAKFVVNGQPICWSETMGWDTVIDGRYWLRMPPMAWNDAQEIAKAIANPTGAAFVEIQIEGLPTVAEIETRLAAVEKALQQSD